MTGNSEHMEPRLHHVGIIVRDLDAAVEQYQQMGFRSPWRETIDEQSVEVATFVSGDGFIELIMPTVNDGGMVRFLNTRGEGMHHIAYHVCDIERALQRYRLKGFELIDEYPRTGAHGWRVAFVHPKSCHGVLTELVQTTEQSGEDGAGS